MALAILQCADAVLVVWLLLRMGVVFWKQGPCGRRVVQLL